MSDGFQIGRIAGIRISIHWSWLVVFVLIIWTLAYSVFPSQNPGFSDSVYVTMAVAAAVLFFTSLLLHELGHAFQARREGIEIDGISLWLFGGVARFRGTFPSAGAEFRIAIAGPLVSLVIGLGFVFIAWMLPLPRAFDGIAAWLGFINLFLLAFNLIPALPLDGGRVLRSALWARSGNLAGATRTAASVARVFAFLLIAAGLAELVLLGSFGGVWLAFLGWFLLQAAAGEARTLAARQPLLGLRVADLMVRDPATFTTTCPSAGSWTTSSRRAASRPIRSLTTGAPSGSFPSGASPRSRGTSGTRGPSKTACCGWTRFPCSPRATSWWTRSISSATATSSVPSSSTTAGSSACFRSPTSRGRFSSAGLAGIRLAGPL